MDRRTRNKLCIWFIVLGLANFLVYGVIYAIIGGDAPNGYIRDDAVTGQPMYYVRGHFVHRTIGYEQDVPRWVWIYSYLHSISIWPSIAAVLLAMLLIARPHILATYQGGVVTGTTLVAILATAIVLITFLVMISFVVSFARWIW